MQYLRVGYQGRRIPPARGAARRPPAAADKAAILHASISAFRPPRAARRFDRLATRGGAFAEIDGPLRPVAPPEARFLLARRPRRRSVMVHSAVAKGRAMACVTKSL